MRFKTQYAIDAFVRIQDLLDAEFPETQGFKGLEARKQLDEVVVALQNHGVQQESLDLAIAGHSEKQIRLQTEIVREHLQPIADFARGKLSGTPNYATLSAGPSTFKGKKLVRAAEAVAEAAAPYLDGLVANGFPADTIDSLKQVTEQLKASLQSRANLKVKRAGDTKGLQEQTQRGYDAVAMLNGMIRKQYAKNPTFLASWQLAKRVVKKPGLPRKAKTAQTGDGAVQPIKPAVPAVTAPAATTPVSAAQPTPTVSTVQGSRAA